MDVTRNTVSNHLRIVRELAGLSPEQAAAKSSRLSASYIRRLEKGTNSPTVDSLIALCRAYGIDIATFFTSMTQRDRKTA